MRYNVGIELLANFEQTKEAISSITSENGDVERV
jgi:hypothetical protein